MSPWINPPTSTPLSQKNVKAAPVEGPRSSGVQCSTDLDILSLSSGELQIPHGCGLCSDASHSTGKQKKNYLPQDKN